jgi:hypothetical protein
VNLVILLCCQPFCYTKLSHFWYSAQISYFSTILSHFCNLVNRFATVNSVIFTVLSHFDTMLGHFMILSSILEILSGILLQCSVILWLCRPFMGHYQWFWYSVDTFCKISRSFSRFRHSFEWLLQAHGGGRRLMVRSRGVGRARGSVALGRGMGAFGREHRGWVAQSVG